MAAVINRRILSEFIGTFAFVFIGAGSSAIGYGGLTGVALAHGLMLFIFISLFASISGAHFNPAITFAMWIRGRIQKLEAIGYVVAQLAASIAAGGLLSLFLSGSCADLGSTHLGDTVSCWQGFGIECLLTFFLAFVIFRSQRLADHPGASAWIGLMLTCAILFAGPLTGASLNPARSLGPCLLSGVVSQLWIYLLAPVLGAWLGSVTDRWLSTIQE